MNRRVFVLRREGVFGSSACLQHLVKRLTPVSTLELKAMSTTIVGMDLYNGESYVVCVVHLNVTKLATRLITLKSLLFGTAFLSLTNVAPFISVTSQNYLRSGMAVGGRTWNMMRQASQ